MSINSKSRTITSDMRLKMMQTRSNTIAKRGYVHPEQTINRIKEKRNGQIINVHKRQIVQCDTDFNLIKKYSSINSAVIHTKIGKGTIKKSCENPQYNILGFKFCYVSELLNKDGFKDKQWVADIDNVPDFIFYPKQRMGKLPKKVAQYDLNGNLINVFENGCMQVQKETGFSDSCINASCLGRLNTSHGFIWKYIN